MKIIRRWFGSVQELRAEVAVFANGCFPDFPNQRRLPRRDVRSVSAAILISAQLQQLTSFDINIYFFVYLMDASFAFSR
ncbi:hypothetical protein [Agrobacterium sp. Azo12]|uniref:hypothetical protein n=1 Tax=Agrobacterium sp. Azo12 TaxID=3031129 RepID=UPI0023D852E5|nr:hypothetical protein [Agrobacterium sp. Azo12]MDO5898822.1 hypothetical protein [Agrobacterium sp. Azo12]